MYSIYTRSLMTVSLKIIWQLYFIVGLREFRPTCRLQSTDRLRGTIFAVLSWIHRLGKTQWNRALVFGSNYLRESAFSYPKEMKLNHVPTDGQLSGTDPNPVLIPLATGGGRSDSRDVSLASNLSLYFQPFSFCHTLCYFYQNVR